MLVIEIAVRTARCYPFLHRTAGLSGKCPAAGTFKRKPQCLADMTLSAGTVLRLHGVRCLSTRVLPRPGDDGYSRNRTMRREHGACRTQSDTEYDHQCADAKESA